MVLLRSRVKERRRDSAFAGLRRAVVSIVKYFTIRGDGTGRGG
jgi:hypothetical protein